MTDTIGDSTVQQGGSASGNAVVAPGTTETAAPPREQAVPEGTAAAEPVMAGTPARAGAGAVAQEAPAAEPSGGLAVTGVLTLLVGAWAGICVFVGPLFGYSVDGSRAWVWNLPHGVLHLAPGAAGVFAGLMMLGAAGRGRRLTAMAGSPGAVTAGFLAAVAGAWLVIGPVAWSVLRPHPVVWALASPLHSLADQVGANLGTGVLLAILGGLAMGLSVLRRGAITRTR